MSNQQTRQIDQPVSVDWHSKKGPGPKEENRTTNPGDAIEQGQSVEEKSKQIAVDSPDITGDHVTVPTYFIVEYPDGEQKALHHVKDAKEISDVIRQARVDENGNRVWW